MSKFGLTEDTFDEFDDLLTTTDWNIPVNSKESLNKIKKLFNI